MPKKYSKIRMYFELFAAKGLLWILARFRLPTSMRLGAKAGSFLGARMRSLNKTAYRNLEIAMPDNSSERNVELVRGTFESLGRHIGFFSHFRYFERHDIRRMVEVVGKEYFFEAERQGRGIIFFTGHFGSWEVFNLLSPAFDRKINILVRRIDNPLLEEFIDKTRTKFGSVTLGKRQAPKQIYKLLERGEVVGILADLNAQLHDGVFVDFFGTPACATKSIAKFARKTNAIIMPAFALWESEHQRYVVHLEPPVEYEVTGDAAADIHQITSKITKIVERYVQKNPEQWLWIHKRWKTRPAGEESLY